MSDDEQEAPTVVVTAQKMLQKGLGLVHYSEQRVGRAGLATNLRRFKDHYGCKPSIAALIFEDLQVTDIPEARLDVKKISLFYYLQSLNFLYVYDAEHRREPIFDRSPKTMQEWVWYYVKKIQGLKALKILWPNSFPADDKWVISVDCTDCPIQEIRTHEKLSQDSTLFSFKVNGAGLRYEFGIDLFHSRVLWMNSPFLPGVYNDNQIFDLKGLREKLASVGKMALADKIYNGHPKECSTFNAVDKKAVKIFKSRTQMRHEQFNEMVKEYAVTWKPFRSTTNKIEKHKSCFEAVTVICQYRLEHGEPLFDLLAGL